MKNNDDSLAVIIKYACRIIFLATFLIACGCSHIHTYRFKSDQNDVLHPPIELQSFFLANGLRQISHEDGLYLMFAQRGEKKLVEIWLGEGVRVFEFCNGRTYEIVVEPWNNGLEASNLSKKLSQWLAENSSNIKVEYDKDPIFQWK